MEATNVWINCCLPTASVTPINEWLSAWSLGAVSFQIAGAINAHVDGDGSHEVRWPFCIPCAGLFFAASIRSLRALRRLEGDCRFATSRLITQRGQHGAVNCMFSGISPPFSVHHMLPGNSCCQQQGSLGGFDAVRPRQLNFPRGPVCAFFILVWTVVFMLLFQLNWNSDCFLADLHYQGGLGELRGSVSVPYGPRCWWPAGLAPWMKETWNLIITKKWQVVGRISTDRWGDV